MFGAHPKRHSRNDWNPAFRSAYEAAEKAGHDPADCYARGEQAKSRMIHISREAAATNRDKRRSVSPGERAMAISAERRARELATRRKAERQAERRAKVRATVENVSRGFGRLVDAMLGRKAPAPAPGRLATIDLATSMSDALAQVQAVRDTRPGFALRLSTAFDAEARAQVEAETADALRIAAAQRKAEEQMTTAKPRQAQAKRKGR